jgi:hypothetical protein
MKEMENVETFPKTLYIVKRTFASIFVIARDFARISAAAKLMESRNTSTESLVRGVLTKVGSIVDRRFGREPETASPFATSRLIAILTQLLDERARAVPGKGTLVPHLINLKLQWDKFSGESEEMLGALKSELTIAAIDHINDSLYHTYGPVAVDITFDYFTEDYRVTASFGDGEPDEFAGDADLSTPRAEIQVEDTEQEAPRPTETLIATITGDTESIRSLTLSAKRLISVGRAASSDLVIDDGSVSKFHATISVGPAGDISVADTGSTNGTYIGGERIAYGIATPVPPGESVTFGDVGVRFEYTSALGES